MTAAETYAARIDAVRAQRARLHGAPPPDDPWEGPVARRFRADPHRPLDANLAVLASYTRPEDVLLDVVYGEEQVAAPGHRELLPVLWELGILPDVHVLPGLPRVPGGPMGARLPQTPDDAVQLALQGQWLGPQDYRRARGLIEERF